MSQDVASKEFEAGLSLLHMMQRPSDASSTGSDSTVSATTPSAATKKRQGGALTPRAPAKKARRKTSLSSTGSLLLAAAQQVDPNLQAAQGRYKEDGEDGEDCDIGSEWSGDTENSSLAGDDMRRNVQLHTLTRELHIDELREHFNKPIVDVAKEFGICTTFLKKICRRCGIKRWPHRQIRSLTRTVEMLRQAEANATSVQERAKYAAQIAQVEAKKRAVIDDPDANGKLERVKKSVLNRSGSPASRKNSADSTGKSKTTGAAFSPPSESALQIDLLQVVAAAAAAARSDERSSLAAVVSPVLTPALTTEAEAAAAEALLFSASPRTMVAPIEVDLPVDDLAVDSLPIMTPTANSTLDSTLHHGLQISPSHRKLLAVLKADGENCVRSSSLGTLQDLASLAERAEASGEPRMISEVAVEAS